MTPNRANSNDSPAERQKLPRPRRRLSLAKKIGYSLLMCAVFFVCLEVLLAVLGVRPTLAPEDPYVGFSSYVPLFVETTEDDGATYLTTAQNKLFWFNEQRFLQEKPDGACRIFCLGGSTTYGRPYYDATSFCGWLREYLPAADPSSNWEVINAGGISYASYRVAKLMEELIEYEPDVFIIYTGHNEFLEERTYRQIKQQPLLVREAGAIAGRSRIYAALSRLARGARPSPPAPTDQADKSMLPGEVKTLLDSAVGPDVYHRDEQLQKQIFAHYRFNLQRMIDTARNAGANVILVTPASNLRDCSPFKSEHRLDIDAGALSAWRREYQDARDAFYEDRPLDALSALDRAEAIDDRFAALHYMRGEVNLALDLKQQAKRDFRRALEEDVCPLRAPAQLAEIVREVAKEKNAPVVDFAAFVEAQAEYEMPGADQFLDHVHPTIEMHRRLALLLTDEMASLQVVRFGGNWGSQQQDEIAQRVMRSIDREEHAAALRNLSKVLSWAGKTREADRLALQAIELLPLDVETQHQAGNAYVRLGQYEEALDCYETALLLDPQYASSHYGRGLVYDRMGDAAKAIEGYQQAISLTPDFVDAHFNLGVVYESLGDFEQAEQRYRTVIQHQPSSPDAHNNLGLILLDRNDPGEARRHFEQAIAADPQHANAYANLGLLCSSEGDLRAAIDWYQKALRHDPDNDFARDLLQEARAALQDRGEQ